MAALSQQILVSNTVQELIRLVLGLFLSLTHQLAGFAQSCSQGRRGAAGHTPDLASTAVFLQNLPRDLTKALNRNPPTVIHQRHFLFLKPHFNAKTNLSNSHPVLSVLFILRHICHSRPRLATSTSVPPAIGWPPWGAESRSASQELHWPAPFPRPHTRRHRHTQKVGISLYSSNYCVRAKLSNN